MVTIPQDLTRPHKGSNMFLLLNKVKSCWAGIVLGWVTKLTNTPCCNNFFFLFFFSPSFSKAILRSAELPFLCNAVFFFFSTFNFFVPHFAMAEFMYIQLDTAGHVVRILLNYLDCWSFKTFNNGLNHSKIRTARQLCDFQCLLFLFRQSSMVKPVWAGIFGKWDFYNYRWLLFLLWRRSCENLFNVEPFFVFRPSP